MTLTIKPLDFLDKYTTIPNLEKLYEPYPAVQVSCHIAVVVIRIFAACI